MDAADLRENLESLCLKQTDLARLLNVTTRGVSLWLVGERSIPGPVEAYLRLLKSMPFNLRQVEMSRVRTKGNTMRNGMYSIQFQAVAGSGHGVLTFEDGLIWGVDPPGARYDGNYEINEATGLADVRLKVTFPPGVQSVLGPQHPYEWSIDVTTQLDPTKDGGDVSVQVSFGGHKLIARYAFLRPLPIAA